MGWFDYSSNWSELPGIPLTFKFEVHPDIDKKFRVLGEIFHLFFILAITYVVCVFYMKLKMKDAKPYGLRLPLALWNFGLSIFSLFTTIRLAPELVDTMTRKGFVGSYCDASGITRDPRVKYWMYLFILSKIVEFGDTVFVLLKKRPLIFLHWFHHATTFLYGFYVMGIFQYPASSRWLISVNAAIHTAMYGYYGLRALGYRFTKLVNMSITTVQILQMVLGVAINSLILLQKRSDFKCDTPVPVAFMGVLLYSSFLVLFVNFFVHTYLIKPPSSSVHVKSS